MGKGAYMQIDNREIKKIKINNVLPGMKLANSIQSEYGKVLIPKGSLINENNIHKLHELNQNSVYIYVDGSGYPDALKGQDIPLFGRILAIVDTFDAITAERNYQKKSSPFKAIKVFVQEDLTHFDHKLKTIFNENIPNLFLQERVLLSNGQEGRVFFINPRHPEMPVVKVEDKHIDLYRKC